MKAHINSIPRVETHYVRASTSREFIKESLTIAELHRLYSSWLKENFPDCQQATYRQYPGIFNTFNIGFHKPKKDQCDFCVGYKNSLPEDQNSIKEKYKEHEDNTEEGRRLKAADKECSLKKENVERVIVGCFDYQKVLSVPKAETSCLYYKKKLSLYDFTIYDITHKNTFCYCYPETVGSKGSNEVASFIYDFIINHQKLGFTKFISYSDNCTGQNRNRFVFSMLLVLAKMFPDIKITHRFLESLKLKEEEIEKRKHNKHVIFKYFLC